MTINFTGNFASASKDSFAEPVLVLTDVRRSFGKTAALNGISFTAKRGEIIGIIGRSGAGKSTLIRCLNGLEQPDSGKIVVDGQRLEGLQEKDLQHLRRRIGMIFQHFNLLSAKSVEANVALPLKIEGLAKRERLARARDLLELVGLGDKAKAYPSQLSGGQKQRVGIARALAAQPSILLSDEATSALDPETTRSILTLLKDINRRLGLTIVLITHEMDVVRSIADRIAVIESGQIVEQGSASQVFANPQEEITKSLLAGSRPQVPDHIRETLDPHRGDQAVLAIDLLGDYAQQQFFADIVEALSKGARIIEGGVEHIQTTAVARFFLTVPRHEESLTRSLHERLLSVGARVEVLGYV